MPINTATSTVMLIDDEPLARRGLRARLSHLAEMREPGLTQLEMIDASSARDALEKLAQRPADVLFVDIQMPGMDGVEMVRSLPTNKRPLIVFTTAFTQHALDAFGLQAVDYLLKPVDGTALKRAWQRVMQLRRASAIESSASVANTPTDSGHSLAVKDGKDWRRIAYDQVLWIEAAGDYVVVHTRAERVIGRSSLQALSESLPTTKFVRIHRSTIVQKQCIVRLRPHDNGEYFVELDTGHRLKLSRGYRDQLTQLI
jgi:two-component system, LytTR family, response regulator